MLIRNERWAAGLWKEIFTFKRGKRGGNGLYWASGYERVRLRWLELQQPIFHQE